MGEGCGGCHYHAFPYKAFLPYLVNGKRVEKTFNNIEDVWDIIENLIKENEVINEEKGKEFDIASSINAQLPFFTCRNHFITHSIQKDIQRYIYCKELGVAPYKGSYGEQPCRWVDVFFLIKNGFAKKEQSLIKQNTNQKEGKSGS